MTWFPVLETLWYCSRINGNWSTPNKEVKEKVGYATIISVEHGLSCFTYCVVVEDATSNKYISLYMKYTTYFLGGPVNSNL